MPKKGKGREAHGLSADLFKHYCDQKKITPEYEWSQVKQFNWNGSPGWRCALRVQGMGFVEGTGGSKKDSQQAAMHEFVCRLQARGIVLQLPRGKGGTAAPSWAINGPTVMQPAAPKKGQQKGGSPDSQLPLKPPTRNIQSEMAMMLSLMRGGEPEKALELAQKQLANEPGVVSVKQFASLVTAVGVRAPEDRVLAFYDGLVAMGAVDFPNSSAATYFTRFSRWAMREFMAEGKACADQASTMIPQLLERNGTCIQLLNVTQGNNSSELQLVPPTGQLPDRHSFQKGDWIFITSPHTSQVQKRDPQEGEEPAAITLEGELVAFLHAPQTGLVVKTVGSGNKHSQKLVGGTCRVDRAANHVTFGRQVHALYMLCTEPGDLDWLSLALMAAEAGGDFEKVSEYCSNPPPTGGFKPNPQILASANGSQFEALKAATSRRLTLIQGPPGAGKTSTAIMLMRLWVASGKKPVLATADSNIAVDNLVSGCAGAALKVTRVGRRGTSRPDLDGYNLFEKAKAAGGGGERFNWRGEKKILEASDVVCCTCSGAEHPAMQGLLFANVLVDEAAQTTELATLVPFLHLKADGCAVLVGDHRQLPATVACLEADVEGLGTSLFERLANLGVQPMLLDIQYRMHPALALYPSQQYYGGRLRSGIRGTARRAPKGIQWPVGEAPIAFLPVEGQEIPEGNSYTNTAEANSIMELLNSVVSGGDLAASSIGVITPYAAQARLLRTFLGIQGGKPVPGAAPTPEVSSVDGFQGREKDLILVSTVRANKAGKVGFVGDHRRLNVTLTRARRGLVVVGDFRTLSQDQEGWRPWLLWAQERGLIVGCDATLPEAAKHLQRLESLGEQDLLAMGPVDAPSAQLTGMLGSGLGSMSGSALNLPSQPEATAPKPRPKSLLMQIREEAEKAAKEQEEGGIAQVDAQGDLPLPESVVSILESSWSVPERSPTEGAGQRQQEAEEGEEGEDKRMEDVESQAESQENLKATPGAERELPDVLVQLRAGDAAAAVAAARKLQAKGQEKISLRQLAGLLTAARLGGDAEPLQDFLDAVLEGGLVDIPAPGCGRLFERLARVLLEELRVGLQAGELGETLDCEVMHTDGAEMFLSAPEGQLPVHLGLQEGDRLLLMGRCGSEMVPLEADLQELLPPPHVGLVVAAVEPDEEVVAQFSGGPCSVARLGCHATFSRQLRALRSCCTEQSSDVEWLCELLLSVEDGSKREVQRACSAAPELGLLDLLGKPSLSTETGQLEVLRAAARRRLTLVQGLPGTGKTRTAAALAQLWAGAGQKPVLAVTSRDAAVDPMLEACKGLGLKVVRVGLDVDLGASGDGKGRSGLRAHSLLAQAWEGGCPAFQQPHSWKGCAQLLQAADVVCCTCTGAGDIAAHGLTFLHVVVDDAPQATEPAALVALSCLRTGGSIVLLGDEQQLPLVTCAPEAHAHGSLFTRLAGLGLEPLPLRVQHRMHPSIADFPSRWAYKGQLRSGVLGGARRAPEGINWPAADVPIAFLPLQGEETQEDGGSACNQVEAEAVVQLISSALLGDDVAPGEVGVITTCHAQASLIRSLLDESASTTGVAGISEAQVGVVEDFQGREKDLIVISTVQSNGTWEATADTDLRRLNVMMTRARRGLLVCGDFKTLSQDSTGWRQWLCWAQRRGLVAGCKASAPAAAAALRRMGTLSEKELLLAEPSEDGVVGDVEEEAGETPQPVQDQEMAPTATPGTQPPAPTAAATAAENGKKNGDLEAPRKRRKMTGDAALQNLLQYVRRGDLDGAVALARQDAAPLKTVPQCLSTILGELPLFTGAQEVERFLAGLFDLGLPGEMAEGLEAFLRRVIAQAVTDYQLECTAETAAMSVASPQELEESGACVSQLQALQVDGAELQLVLPDGQLPERHTFLIGDRVLVTSPCDSPVQLGVGASAGAVLTGEAQVKAILPSPEEGFTLEVLGADAPGVAQQLAKRGCRVDRCRAAAALRVRLKSIEALCKDFGDLTWLRPAFLHADGMAPEDGECSVTEQLGSHCRGPCAGGGFRVTSQVLSSTDRNQFEALRAATTQRLAIIRGPAGSGKTRVAALLAHLRADGGGPVLAAAVGEAASAELAACCAGFGLKLVHVGGPVAARVDSKGYVLAERARATGLSCGEGVGWQGERQALGAADVICCSLSAFAHPALAGLRFGTVLVDGAHAVSEAAALPMLAALKADGCLALFGDSMALQQQDVSLLGRLVACGVQPIDLAVQYRAHPALVDFASRHWYSSLVRSGLVGSARKPPEGFVWPVEEAAVAFLPLAGEECAEADGSFSNGAEVVAVLQLLDGAITEGGLRPSQVAVVSPWAAQVRLMRKTLQAQWPLLEISKTRVCSVDDLQGSERDLILVSTVRTNGAEQTTSVEDLRRLHVLLTRARRGLVVCGHFSTLAKDITGWRPWLSWAQQRGLVVGCNATSLSSVEELRGLNRLSQEELLHGGKAHD